MSVRYGYSTDYPVCDECGLEVEYEDCFNCGGEGGRNLYEDDPLYYSPDDWEDCSECGGGGTLIWCPDHGRLEFAARRPVLTVVDQRGRV